MASRAMEFERRTLLVQFLSVQPLTFFPTSDGTDLVQDILRKQLVRPDADILGQEGSISLDEQGEFLSFEPTDTKNRPLHLPVEHLAYAGALRRMRPDPSDQRNPDQIYRRDFENVDLANRYAQHIIGPPIFVAVFHGFDKALCYTFVTQSADDACLLVMKLMRAFKSFEEKLDEERQGFLPASTPSSSSSIHRFALPSPVAAPLFVNDQRGLIHSSPPSFSTNMFTPQGPHDDFLQQLLANPNLHVVQEPYQGSSPFVRPADACVQSMCIGPNPQQIIHRRNEQDITYKQNVIVRWIKAPTPPPPAPIIIREIQAPPQVQPPLICRQVPPCPPTPPPIVVREAPPVCPPAGPPVIVERRLPGGCLPRQGEFSDCSTVSCPPPKPRTVIYEKYLPPPPPRPRQVIIQREQCVPSRRLVKEIVRHVPQPPVVCAQEQQQQITQGQSQVVQQLVPVFATRQHVVQPKGIRVIRQVIGPAQGSVYPTAVH